MEWHVILVAWLAFGLGLLFGLLLASRDREPERERATEAEVIDLAWYRARRSHHAPDHGRGA